MGDQDSIYLTQTILWEPFQCGGLEVFAHVDDNSSSTSPGLGLGTV